MNINKRIDFIPVLLSLVLFGYFFIPNLLFNGLGSSLEILNILNFAIAYIIFSNTSREIHSKYFRILLFVSILAFSYEAFYRFTHPYTLGQAVASDLDSVDMSDSFYPYKSSSLMYLNSNGVGLHSLFLLGLVLYCRQILPQLVSRKEFYMFTALLVTFCVLSLSRASIILAGVIVLLFLYLNSSLYSKVISLFISSFVFALGLFHALELLRSDFSFESKFEILNNTIVYVSHIDFPTLILGNTFGNPELIFNRFSGFVGHTHYFTLVFFGGVAGTSIFVCFILLISSKNRYLFLFVVMPFILIGFINARVFAHYFYFYMGYALALLSAFENHEDLVLKD
ncbi:hypothetical protein [Vibrio superstes]|nr:hypothetical protein [Vibrio superstes]